MVWRKRNGVGAGEKVEFSIYFLGVFSFIIEEVKNVVAGFIPASGGEKPRESGILANRAWHVKNVAAGFIASPFRIASADRVSLAMTVGNVIAGGRKLPNLLGEEGLMNQATTRSSPSPYPSRCPSPTRGEGISSREGDCAPSPGGRE